MFSRQLSMQESSSRVSSTQPSPRPSSTLASSYSESVSENQSQVEVINRALSTAKVLGRVRRERLAQSEPPVARQVLVRTLKKNLERRLSQISLTNSHQGSTLDSQVSESLQPLPLEHHSPRTSSPLNLSFSITLPQEVQYPHQIALILSSSKIAQNFQHQSSPFRYPGYRLKLKLD